MLHPTLPSSHANFRAAPAGARLKPGAREQLYENARDAHARAALSRNLHSKPRRRLRGLEEHQIETERQTHSLRGARLHRPVDRKQDVFDRRCIEISRSRDTRLAKQREALREFIERPAGAVAPGAAQLDEIVRRGNGDKETPVIAQHAPEFCWIHARGDGEDDGERAVRIRHGAIGVGDHPFAFGIAARGGVDRGDRDIDPMGVASGLALQQAEVETVAASGVENNVAGSCGQRFGDGAIQRRGDATVMQAAAGGDGIHGIAWMFRAPLLWLQQIDVPAACDVEGMAARTRHPPRVAYQFELAAAHGAKEHPTSVTNGSPAVALPQRVPAIAGLQPGRESCIIDRPNAMSMPEERRETHDWNAVACNKEFKELMAAKARFIVPATLVFVVYYFALPILVGYAPAFMSTPVWGPVNIAYLFALSQFFVAWFIAWMYVRAAGRFDRMARGVLDRTGRDVLDRAGRRVQDGTARPGDARGTKEER